MLIELVRHGVRLWIDKPYHPDLGLPTTDFAGCIERTLAGEVVPAKDQIDRAILNSNGVIYFPSTATKGSEQVNVELGMGIVQRRIGPQFFQVTPCFLDQAAFGQAEWRISDIQGFSTFVVKESDAYRLTDLGVSEVAELAMKLNTHLNQMAAHQMRGERWGAFSGSDAEIADPPLTAEQVSALVSMLNRETAVQDLVDSENCIMLLTGQGTSGVRHLTKRLPTIELPLRTCGIALQEVLGGSDRESLKASLVCGAIGEAGRTWQHRSLSWCDETKRSADDGFNDIMKRLLSPVAASAGTSAMQLAKSPSDLANCLASARKRIFVWTEFLDKPALRRRNEEIVQRLYASFAVTDPCWFRLLVHVAPAPKTFGASRTESWVQSKLAQRAPSSGVVSLEKVGRSELIEWEQLAGHIVATPQAEIAEELDAAYNPSRASESLHFQDLESTLKPRITTWKSRDFANAANNSKARSRKWNE